MAEGVWRGAEGEVFVRGARKSIIGRRAAGRPTCRCERAAWLGGGGEVRGDWVFVPRVEPQETRLAGHEIKL